MIFFYFRNDITISLPAKLEQFTLACQAPFYIKDSYILDLSFCGS